MMSRKLRMSSYGAYDPLANYVTMLLDDNGVNATQNNTFLDSSTNNFAITRTGAATQGSVSPYGDRWSNQFSGSGQYLTAPNNTAFDFGSGDFTVEMWIYPTGTAGDLFTKRATTGNFPPIVLYRASNSNIGYSGSTTGSSWNINGSFSTGTIATPLNTWSHIALVRRSGTFTSYVNGVADLVVSGVTAALMTNTSGITIAAGSTAGSAPFPGYMSNTRIVKGTALYTSNFTPPTTPLTAVSGTSLLTCQSNRFRDNSSNNFAITVTGTPSVQRFSPFHPAAEYSTSVIGGSGYFSGSGQYLTNATAPVTNFGTGNFSVEYWVYPTTTNITYQQHIGSATTSTGFGCGMLNTAGTIYATTISVGYDTGVAFAKNAWTHIAWVRNGTTLTAYRNGTSIGSFTVSTNFNETGLGIGAQPNGAFVTTACYLSNIRVVKGTAGYTANFTPPTSPVTAITNTSLLLNFTNAGIYDTSTLNDLVTVGNAQVSTGVKKYGTGSMYFDGTGDYLSSVFNTSFDLLPNSFTVEGWFYTTNLKAGGQRIFATGGGTVGWNSTTGIHVLCQINDATGSLSMQLSTNTASPTQVASAAGSITTNTWTYLAYVYDSATTTGRIFVNGVLVATANLSSVARPSTNPTMNIASIPGENGAVSIAFQGYISDFRITKQARYAMPFTPPLKSLPQR